MEQLQSKATKGLLIALAASLIFWAGIKYAEYRLIPTEPIIVNSQEQTENTETKENETIFVHVVGAVDKSGVYTLEKGKRIADVLALANPAEDADLSRLNLAALLVDEQQIVVYKMGEVETPSVVTTSTQAKVSSSSKTSNSAVININTANLTQLDSLPGIGQTYAQRIIEYREKNGGFKTINEIQSVKGIGPATFDKIKDFITV